MRKKALLICLFLGIGHYLPISLFADQVYTIYPIPQEQKTVTGKVSLSSTVNVVCDDDIDSYTKDRLSEILQEKGITATFSSEEATGQTNVYLAVAGSNGPADLKATSAGIDRSVLAQTGKFDRHIVSLTANGNNACLIVLGENTDAVFYGLASFEQMLDGGTTNLQCVTINDYADQQSRGLVEGYYGYPYSLEVKKDLMKFMARYKLNTYLYGAKSDPYHSGYWEDPYPTTITETQEKNGWLTQDMFKELTDQAHASKVNFIWAIHPGLNTKTDENVSQVFGKFQKMYDLGVRQFAVFTDDVGVESSSEFPKYTYFFTKLQNKIDETYNVNYTSPADTVKPLHFVPHIYAVNFANAATRKTYFNELSKLPEKIVVYTTGGGVWSVPNSSDLLTIKNDLGRDLAWWWNYPCNDNADSQIFPSDMYTNFYDMPSVSSSATLPTKLNNGKGILSNPMQQGEISKIALFSVADYAWNNAAFNNKESWNNALPAVIGSEYLEAFKTLAPYLRYNDPSDLTTAINKFKTSLQKGQATGTDLETKMNEIIEATNKLAEMANSDSESDRLFYNDLKPWNLLLHDMAEIFSTYNSALNTEDVSAKWQTYLSARKNAEALATDAKYEVETLEGMGVSPAVGVRPADASANSLKPFVSTWLGSEAFNSIFPEREEMTKPVMFSTLSSETKLTPANNSGTIYYATTKTLTVQPNELFGVKLVAPVQIQEITVADTLAGKFQVVCSPNGKVWTALENGELPQESCRYICLKNISSEGQSLKPTKATFCIKIPQTAVTVTSATIPSGDVWQNHGGGLIYDGDYTTFCTLNRNQQTNDAYQLTLRTASPIYDVRVCMGTTNGDYMQVGNVQISEDGTTWTSIPIKGYSTVNFTMSHNAVKKYSDEMSYCDFDGKGAVAKYVRLLVKTANTSKWLRLYEIEVNKLHNKYGDCPTATDADGNVADEVFDNQASTAYSSTSKGSLVYNLLNAEELDGISFFIDGTSTYSATVSATRDGENWVDLGSIEGFTPYVSLTRAGMKDAIAIKVEWTGKSPVIYEICENVTTPSTDISDIIADASNQHGVSLVNQNGRLTLQSPTGIKSVQLYTVDGRLLMQLKTQGEQTVVIPKTPTLAIIKATTANDQTVAYKTVNR